jgi:hypothetical protein
LADFRFDARGDVMVWRVVEHGERRWNVTVAAERRANSAEWSLVFSFRCAEPVQRTLWATYPLSSSSKAALFAQAERLSTDALAAFLAEQLD